MRDDERAFEAALTITGELWVFTHASRWVMRSDSYRRSPRDCDDRMPTSSIDGALDDDVWHAHEGVWLLASIDGLRLRILPSGRPAGSRGVLTGEVVAIHRR